MIGRQNLTSLFLALGLALPLAVACGSDGDDDGGTATPEPATDAPTPTEAPPTPTPVPPMDTWQKMTTLAIASESGGLDIDGDGGKDNGIYDALDSIASSLTEAANAGIDAQVDAGVLTQQQGNALKQVAAGIIEGVVSVDTINNALATNIEDATGFIAYNLKGSGSSFTIFYWQADAQAGGEVIVPTDQVGEMSGSEDPRSGSVMFGPGEFELGAVIEIPATPQSEGQTIDLTFPVQDALTKLEYDETLTQDALTGGGIEIVALTALVEQLVGTLVDAGVPIEDPQAVIDGAEASLIAASDIDCSTGDPCFSISLQFDAITAVASTSN